MYNIVVIQKGEIGMQKESSLFYSFAILSEIKDKCDFIEKNLRNIHAQCVSIKRFKTEESLMENIDNSSIYTIYLLDIQHDPHIIDLAKRIQKKHPYSFIIFFSDFLDDALHVFEIQNCYFIHYPKWESFINSALQKAEQRMIDQSHKVQLIMKDRTLLLPMKEIQYLERVKRMTYIHANEIYHDARNLTFHLNNLNWYFIQCHRSFIVNLCFVREYHRDKFILHDGNEIPISRPYSKNVKLVFEHYLTIC